MNLSGITPTWVTPIGLEEFPVQFTEAEDMSKEYYLLSNVSCKEYRLQFNGLSDVDFSSLIAQYKSVTGEYTPFYWSTVPSYIDAGNGSGVSIYGRWISEPRFSLKARTWDVEIDFRKEE